MSVRLSTILAGLIAAAVALGAWQSGLLDSPERNALDARFTLRGEEPPDRSVVIVALDENSLARLPPAPLPRRIWAQLIDRLHRDGARLIVFDIAFNRPTPDDDRLRAAARRAAPVVFGTSLIDTNGGTLVLGGAEQQQRIGARIGATLLPVDPDLGVRRVPYGVKGLRELSVITAQTLGTRVDRDDFDALIDYAGGRDTYPTVSLHQVLDGRIPASRFAGKTVLIGATAPALQDLHRTPFGQMPGVEIHANILGTVRAGVPLRPASDLWTALAIVLLAAVAPLASLRLPLVAALITGLVAAAAYLLVAQVAFAGGRVLEVAGPVLGSVVSGVATLTLGYLAANRERQRLRQAFAAYEPGVVDDVLAGGVSALSPSAVVGGYRIEEVVGRGGMAVVYSATQLLLDRPVALKLIAPQFGQDAHYRERFLHESRLAASVEHSHIIPVYEAGDDDGVLFIAMRFVKGLDLGDLLEEQGKLGPADAVRITGQVGAALEAAHARGLVHRDVKPANVLLAEDSQHAYLTDFGIAHAAGAANRLTQAGAFLGTPAYCAPEQIEGQEIDGRADVYALGVVLYVMLTGALPYDGEHPMAILRAHVDADVPVISDVDPALAPFDPVIATAMAKDPADRPAGAVALADLARAALGA